MGKVLVGAGRVCAGLLLLAGCDASQAEDGFVVRDSAGVEIVESRDPAWGDGEGWRVDPEPTLSLGTASGDPEQEFARITGVFSLPEDRIVVLDAGNNELRLFDVGGDLLATAGGEGEGPGEFGGRLSGVPLGDSIVVLDAGASRLTLFDHDLQLVETRPVRSAPEVNAWVGQHVLIGVVPRRGYLFKKESGMGRVSSGEPTVWWDAGANFVAGYDGVLVDSIGPPSGLEMWGGDGRSGFLRWGRATRADVHDGHLYIGSGPAYELEVYARTGELERIVRRTHEPMSGEAADAAVVEWATAVAEEEGYPPEAVEEVRQQLADEPSAEALPAFSDLTVDALGNLWVERNRAVWRRRATLQEPPVWDVFDPSGRWLGGVTLPERFTPYEIGERALLGVWTDEYDVQHVRMYEVARDSDADP